jgi:hypothetical protein
MGLWEILFGRKIVERVDPKDLKPGDEVSNTQGRRPTVVRLNEGGKITTRQGELDFPEGTAYKTTGRK